MMMLVVFAVFFGMEVKTAVLLVPEAAWRAISLWRYPIQNETVDFSAMIWYNEPDPAEMREGRKLGQEKKRSMKGKNTMSDGKTAKKIAVGVAAGIGVILLGLGSVATVPVGSTGVVLNMGKVTGKTMSEGLNFKTPFVVSVVSMSNMVQKLDAEAYATSKDLQAITSDVTVNYHLAAERSASMYQNVGKNYADTLLQPAVQEVIKSVMAQYSAEQLISNRSAVSVAISDGLSEKVSNYGIIVDEFNIVNFSFSAEFDAAIEAKQVAEQNKIKAQTEKDKKVIDAEAQAAEKRIAAQAEAEAIRLKAEAEAEAIKLKAEAQAEANALLNNSLSKNVLYYQQLQKWDGKYPNMIAGDGSGIILDVGSADSSPTQMQTPSKQTENTSSEAPDAVNGNAE